MHLAYEFRIYDMTEVLEGLRARLGPPLSTSFDDDTCNDQGKGSEPSYGPSYAWSVQKCGKDVGDCPLRMSAEDCIANDDGCMAYDNEGRPANGNGVCEDGGMGAVSHTCHCGRDVSDCGARSPEDWDLWSLQSYVPASPPSPPYSPGTSGLSVAVCSLALAAASRSKVACDDKEEGRGEAWKGMEGGRW